MIIVKLTGGLGNQMFQYAAAHALAHRRNVPLTLDLRSYRDSTRPYLLDNFCISAARASNIQIFLKKYVGFGPIFAAREFPFHAEVLDLPGNAYLDGYFQGFQSERYFADYKETICKEFQLRNPLGSEVDQMTKEIIGSCSVSVHIRRGDYLAKQQTFHILELEYYKAALAKVCGDMPQVRCFFFSDDIEWVKQNMTIPDNSVFVSNYGFTDIEEFHLMSLCKHHIIANSSFSWWAAWLGNNQNTMIIAPKIWFNNPTLDTRDLIPSSWITI